MYVYIIWNIYYTEKGIDKVSPSSPSSPSRPVLGLQASVTVMFKYSTHALVPVYGTIPSTSPEYTKILIPLLNSS